MRSRRAGYSLLEVLIAFAIMSAVLAVLLPGQSRLLGRAVSANEALLAKDFSESLVAEFGLSRDIAIGRDGFDYRDWQVETIAEALQGSMQLVRITVTIRRSGSLLAESQVVKILP